MNLLNHFSYMSVIEAKIKHFGVNNGSGSSGTNARFGENSATPQNELINTTMTAISELINSTTVQTDETNSDDISR
jgi:hypothetical protein